VWIYTVLHFHIPAIKSTPGAVRRGSKNKSYSIIIGDLKSSQYTLLEINYRIFPPKQIIIQKVYITFSFRNQCKNPPARSVCKCMYSCIFIGAKEMIYSKTEAHGI